MSRASEYAKKSDEAKAVRPESFSTDRASAPLASVRDDGWLVFTNTIGFPMLSPENALALAKWITDTFGDEKPHVCGLPAHVTEALNSGDGTYKP